MYRATRGKVWFGQVSIVVPTLWTDSNCAGAEPPGGQGGREELGGQINYPGEGTPYKVTHPIIVVTTKFRPKSVRIKLLI